MKMSRTTTAALTGAVALASGAYALGTQEGDGSAVARSSDAAATAVVGPSGYGPGSGPGRPGHDRRGARDLSGLASRLGVGEEALRTALQELRDARDRDRDDHHEALAATLAGSLGVSQDKVEHALDALHGDRDRDRQERRQAFAAAVANQLGVDAAKVRAALQKVRDDGPPRRGDRAAGLQELAQELGVSTEKLQAALRAARPDRDARKGPGPGRDRTADLAKALGVSTAKLEAALDDARTALQKEHEQERAQFEEQLAQKLGIPVDRVRDALPDGPGPGGPGFGGRRGHHGP